MGMLPKKAKNWLIALAVIGGIIGMYFLTGGHSRYNGCRDDGGGVLKCLGAGAFTCAAEMADD